MGGNIALFHPEGNFPNNPHLSGLLELLLERGHALHVYCAQNPSLGQARAHPRLFVHPVPRPPGPWDYLRGVLQAPDADEGALRWLARERLPRFSLALGVDLGIVEAARVARAQGIAHGLLSYELYFAEEVPPGFKRHEIEACADLAFALCQDAERGGHLARENHIAPQRILNMPVAGRGPARGGRSRALHEALGLDPGVKIAVCIGSLDAGWSGTGQLLADVPLWPEDWVLVLHHRYDSRALAARLAGLDAAARRKIFLSPFQSLPAGELHRLLHACDLGLCFYTPTYDHPLQGRNLEHIGMASGKFSTCLQHGLPVLVNSQGEMGAHVAREGLGWQVREIGETHAVLAAADAEALEACRARCLDFFARRCDLDVTSPPLLAAIDAAVGAAGAPGGPGAGPDVHAWLLAARLCLADGDPGRAAQALCAGVGLARGAEDFEALYAQALDLQRLGLLEPALAAYRCIHEDARVGAALASWALFKGGEALLDLGRADAAREAMALALARNPAHAKAALFLAPGDAPLAVRLGAGQGAAGAEEGGGVIVPMDPLDAGLWRYYFARRRPDRVQLRLERPLSGDEAGLLAGLLAEYLAPGGEAAVRPAQESGALAAACAAAGLAVRGVGGGSGEAAAMLVQAAPAG